MEFLNIGEKIKNLRKQLEMKQEDLSDTNITRAFISMIENGKRNPNKDTAELIANKFRAKADELGIVLSIDNTYLARDSREDAELYCTQKLQNIYTVNDIESIIEIGEKYNLNNILALTYARLGDITFENKNYIESFAAYVNAVDYYNNIGIMNKVPYLYNMMGRCKINQVQFAEALTYFKFATNHGALQDDYDIKKRSIYNIALCNKKLGNIEDAIKYLDLYLSICDKGQDFTLYINATILKSTCYESQDLIDLAIETSNKLLTEFTDIWHPLLGNIYNNLGSFYLQKDCFNKSIECFDMSQKIRENIDRPNLSHTVIEKSFVYIKQNLHTHALDLLKYGAELASNNNDMEYELKAYYSLADIYIYLKLYNDAEYIYQKSLDLLKKNSIDSYRNELINIHINLSNIYLEQNDINKLRDNLIILKNLTRIRFKDRI